jgi:hypothetical protein
LGLSNKLKGNSGVVSLKKGFLAVFLRPWRICIKLPCEKN